KDLRRGGICRQLNRGSIGRDVDRRIELFRQSGRAEAGRNRATDSDSRAEIVTGRDLADLGIAEIGIVFGAPGDVELQFLDRGKSEIDIAGIVFAAMRA